MSKIAFLSWNIENLGVKKTRDSGSQIYNLIAFVAKQVKADIIGLMELPSKNSDKIQTGILILLTAITDGEWRGVSSILNTNNHTAYLNHRQQLKNNSLKLCLRN